MRSFFVYRLGIFKNYATVVYINSDLKGLQASQTFYDLPGLRFGTM